MVKKRSVSSSRFIQKKRRRLLIRMSLVGALLLCLFFGAALLSHLDKLAVSQVEVTGVQVITPDEVREVINAELDKKYFGLFSKRNILIFPKERIVEQVKETWKRVQEIEIERESLTALSVSIVEEKPEYLWCGTDIISESECYFLNDSGYVFARAPNFSGVVFVKFFGELASSTEVLGSSFLPADEFEKVISFVESVEKIRMRPEKLEVRNEQEYAVHLVDKAQVIFTTRQDVVRSLEHLRSVIQKNAFTVGVKNSPLRLEYIDLRFGNNIYYKIHGAQ